MPIQLQVPWRKKLLTVAFHGEAEAIQKMRSHEQWTGVRVEGNCACVTVSGFFDDTKRVPDYIKYCISGIEAQSVCDVIVDDQETQNGFVLVLESPHKSEYNKEGEGQRPAMGTTGRNICKYLNNCVFHQIAERCREDVEECQHVILANAIQYQASLHGTHGGNLDEEKRGRLKDAVLPVMWSDQHIQCDFLSRLEQYQPRTILNACTKLLSPWISALIRNHYPTTSLYEIGHPSSWHRRPENRTISAIPAKPENIRCMEIPSRLVPAVRELIARHEEVA